MRTIARLLPPLLFAWTTCSAAAQKSIPYVHLSPGSLQALLSATADLEAQGIALEGYEAAIEERQSYIKVLLVPSAVLDGGWRGQPSSGNPVIEYYYDPAGKTLKRKLKPR